MKDNACVIRPRFRFEGEIAIDGVSFSETDQLYVVAIRRSDNIMWVRIPKVDPQSYTMEVKVKNFYDERLW